MGNNNNFQTHSNLDPHETAATTCIVRPPKMQREMPTISTDRGRKCQETFVHAEGHSTRNPGNWTRDFSGPSPSGQTLPYPHPSVNPTVKHGGTAQMTAGRHHSPPDKIKQGINYRQTVPFPLSLPHSAFPSTTHRKTRKSDLVCCQPPIQHKGANPRC